MADEPAKTPIQNKYAQQYADDLAANRKEQGDLTTQIADLQERLEQLKVEEGWLAQAQSSLPGAVALGEPGSEPAAEVPSAAKDEEPNTSAPAEAVTDAPPIVPQPRQDESGKAEQEQSEQPAKKAAAGKKTTGKKTAAKKTAAKTTTAKKAAAKKTTAKKSAGGQPPAPEAAITEAPGGEAAAEEKSGPPLWQLALEILLKTPGQPCVAREVHNQLAQEHPGRATSVQTVRNNLETLVKKGLAEKSRQQGNAMYTANAAADAAPEADGTVGDEAGQADETAAGKVPAEV
ncbi:BlaI/MecI/CopY family transcriptional regulator [Streptomyces ardesiacus]|uniref:BlaI/MecI/CopY family transcriptional regulator n=1 Tax=Streptomyces ardesiacus TaxID=285564 RepID=UPI0036944744